MKKVSERHGGGREREEEEREGQEREIEGRERKREWHIFKYMYCFISNHQRM